MLQVPMTRTFRVGHMACGIGAGARGFNQANPRVDLVEGNAMAIDGTRYCVTTCKARFRPVRGEEWERALLAALEAAYLRDPIGYQQERARLVRKAKRG